MSPTSTKSPLRRIAIAMCAAVTILFLALWAVGQFRCFALIRETGTLVRIETIPDGQMGAWEYSLTTWSVQTYPHQLRLIRGSYLSIMASESEKHRFDEQLGWRTNSFPSSAIGIERYPWFAAEHNGQWRVLGFGPTLTTRSGETARTFDTPYWLLIVIFGTPVLFAFLKYRQTRRRLRAGCCLKCGYQLDAGMTKCPECGTVRDIPPQSRISG